MVYEQLLDGVQGLRHKESLPQPHHRYEQPVRHADVPRTRPLVVPSLQEVRYEASFYVVPPVEK